MSRRFLEPLARTPFREGHQKIYQKVRGALGENAFRYCDKLHRIIRITGFGSSDSSKRGQVIDTLLQAMEDKRRVQIVYQSMQATEPVEQELGPQGLIWHNGSLYLIAWSARRQEIRNYKVGRIESAEIGSGMKASRFFSQVDGSVRMHLQLTELSAVTKWIRGFGANAIAIEPPALIDRIRRELAVMSTCYESMLPVSPTRD